MNMIITTNKVHKGVRTVILLCSKILNDAYIFTEKLQDSKVGLKLRMMVTIPYSRRPYMGGIGRIPRFTGYLVLY